MNHNEREIDKIRQESISEIKEKVRNNQKFLHPINIERLEFQKKLRFESGIEFTYWMQKNGIMNNSTIVQRKYLDKWAKDLGYENKREYDRDWTHRTGICNSLEDNKDSHQYFGIQIGEKVIFKRFLENIFEYVEQMRYGNPEFDFKCKNIKNEFIIEYPNFRFEINREYKIQIKLRTLNKLNKWEFPINYNNADYFILAAFDEEKLYLLHIWIIHKNDTIREKKFWRRDKFSLVDKKKYTLPFNKYELKEDKLIELNLMIKG